MIVFPNCKINLGLSIAGKRADGYHDLQTVFYPIPLKDVLEMVRQPDPGKGMEFSLSGLPVKGDPADNLCVRAWQLLQKDFPQLPPVQMHLHKAIPMGAGLGGGSADGAFALMLINEKFQLGLSTDQLLDYALHLGSDCPFFILNTPCIASGRGEQLTPVSLDLSPYAVLLVHPPVHINTGWAFSQITPTDKRKPVAEIIQQPIYTWKKELVNDFEAPVCKEYPALQSIKERLYEAGAMYASMTGSGSCFFGIFPKNHLPEDIAFEDDYKVYRIEAL